MRRVAGVSPHSTSIATWLAAGAVAVLCVLAALYVADRGVSSHTRSAPRIASIAPEPTQVPNREKKAAREPGRRIEARLTPQFAPPKPAEPGAADLPPQTGRASWYALQTATASGEVMDGDGLTAAHRTLPLGSKVKVENLDNGRAIVVRINDRGPFAKDRIIDLSKQAAEELGMVEDGVANVRVSLVDVVATNVKASGEAPPVTR
jgi:rare lipoprotein A